MKKVDTHAHIFTHDAQMIENARYHPKNDALLVDYIHLLDTHQMDYGVLIQPSFLGFDNHYMIEGIAQYPDRLKGVAVLPYDVPMNEIKQLSQKGIVGVRLNLFGQKLPETHSTQWKRFLSMLSDVNWQLELHCPPDYLRHILPTLADYSCPVVIDHFGRIDPDKGVADACYQEFIQQLNPSRHWIKVSGFYRLGAIENALVSAKQALDIFRKQGMLSNLVWGSDWPHTQYEEMTYNKSLNAFYQLIENELEREMILSTNALNIFEFTT